MKRSIACSVVVCAALLVAIARVRAHGGPPSALGIVAANADGRPGLVLLNEGLATTREGRFTFLCPRLWGDADTSSGKTPLARSVDGIDTFVIGTDDLYVARDGELTAQGRPELSSAAVVALAGDDESLFGLSLSSEGSAVVRIAEERQPALFASTEFWSALALVGGGLELARVSDDGELVRLSLDRDGQVQRELRTAIEGVSPQVRLRSAGGRTFAVLFDAERYTLGELDAERWVPLLSAAGPIDGPQASADGTLWVALDGQLMREANGVFEPVGEARRVTCLDQIRGHAHACVGSDIHRLTDAGLGARLFQLEGLYGPDPSLVPAAAARECEYQWLLFENDLAHTGLAPRDFIATGSDAGGVGAPVPPAVTVPSGAGCRVTAPGARAGSCAALALAGLALLRAAPRLPSRRRRR